MLEVGGDQQWLAWAWAANGLTEAPMMFLGARWFARFRYSRLLLIGFAGYTLVWALMALANTPFLLLLCAGSQWSLLWDLVGSGGELCGRGCTDRIERDGTSAGWRGTIGHRLEHWLGHWRAICGTRRVATRSLRWHPVRRWSAGVLFWLGIGSVLRR